MHCVYECTQVYVCKCTVAMVMQGPAIEIGEDYSKGRKNDYEVVVTKE